MIRIFAFTVDLFYKTGPSGLTAAVLADGCVMAGTYMEVPVPAGHTHARFLARSATGNYRVELLN